MQGPGRHLWMLLALTACSAPSSAELGAEAWVYHVTVAPGADELTVSATLPPGPAQSLGLAKDWTQFLSGAQVRANGTLQPIAAIDGEFHVASSDQPRALEWRFAARAASKSINDIDIAAWRGNGFLGSLGAFLLHPVENSTLGFELRVETPAGLLFACACDATPAGWRGALDDLSMLPSCVFGEFTERSLSIPTGPGETAARITIVELSRREAASAQALDAWAQDAAQAIVAYFGNYPVEHLLLIIAAGRHRGISGGTARGLGGGARIFVDVPARFGPQQFRSDWVLFHEMVHLTMPSLPPAQHWFEEGSATYIEPLLQARAGRTSEGEVWTSMLSDYGQGLFPANAGGLDDDASWGRTYYGGAIFCLLADIEIRRRTNNEKSLQDALRAVVAAGGNITQMAPIEQVLRTGDQATGTEVLTELYAKMRHDAGPQELDSLWQRLGVRLEQGHAVFDDAAPLAFVRKALVLGP